MAHQLGGLAAIKIIRHPGREQRLVAQQVLAAGGAEVERLQRLVKLQAGRPDRLELRPLLRRQRPGMRRELPRLGLEQRLGVEGGTDRGVGQVGHDEGKAAGLKI